MGSDSEWADRCILRDRIVLLDHWEIIMKRPFKNRQWDPSLTKELCPSCHQMVFVADKRFVRHKPAGGHKDGPNCIGSGNYPRKVVKIYQGPKTLEEAKALADKHDIRLTIDKGGIDLAPGSEKTYFPGRDAGR